METEGWFAEKHGSYQTLVVPSNGTVFCLDELAHLSGREVAKVIYTLASGIGKIRMTTAAVARDPHRWKTFAILSSETSLEAKITADGENWTGGQAVRIADVDVSGINRLLDQGTLDKIADTSRNYGHAGPAFVRALVEGGHHERAAEIKEKSRDAMSPRRRGFSTRGQIGACAATVSPPHSGHSLPPGISRWTGRSRKAAAFSV